MYILLEQVNCNGGQGSCHTMIGCSCEAGWLYQDLGQLLLLLNLDEAKWMHEYSQVYNPDDIKIWLILSHCNNNTPI